LTPGYLAFGGQLLLVAVRRVSGDLTGPESESHHQISTSHHQQRQEVDQDGHTHIVPATTPERAKVHTSFTQVEVQTLVFKNTLVKVEVLTKLLYSSKSKEGFEMYFSKKYP